MSLIYLLQDVGYYEVSGERANGGAEFKLEIPSVCIALWMAVIIDCYCNLTMY